MLNGRRSHWVRMVATNYRVDFAPEARDDLRCLYLYIAERGGCERAMAYIARLEAYCAGFAVFPERGVPRDDILPGLRVVGFERRVSLAFRIGTGDVVFLRILYGGRDLTSAIDPVG